MTTPDTRVLWTPERNQKILIPEFVGPYQEFTRELINPPEKFEEYDVLSPEDSLRAVAESELPINKQMALLGLLKHGDAVEYPGGKGLKYEKPFKALYMPTYAVPAAKVLAEAATNAHANLIAAPDNAPILLSRDVSSHAGDLDVFRIQKNGGHAGSPGFIIRSYTNGEPNVIYFHRGLLQEEVNNKAYPVKRIFVTDDIIDTGELMMGVINTVKWLQEREIPVELVGIGVAIEKTYTGAREKIQDALDIPITAAVQVEDLWTRDRQGRSGMKVTGIDQGLSFFQQTA